jgi:hypothetical protein
MRYAARVDANQDQVVSALRAAGAYVWIIGLPVDLLVGYNDETFLFELKDFFEKWKGASLHRINSPDDALRIIGAIK